MIAALKGLTWDGRVAGQGLVTGGREMGSLIHLTLGSGLSVAGRVVSLANLWETRIIQLC